MNILLAFILVIALISSIEGWFLPLKVRMGSTIVKPKKPKTKSPKTKSPGKDPAQNEEIIFKPSIAQQFEDLFKEEDDEWMVILFNDPFNKRAYVSEVLQDTFNFSEEMADAVMLTAHNYGFAVVGEWYKELAHDYVDKLTTKGLVAEAKKSSDASGDNSDGGEA